MHFSGEPIRWDSDALILAVRQGYKVDQFCRLLDFKIEGEAFGMRDSLLLNCTDVFGEKMRDVVGDVGQKVYKRSLLCADACDKDEMKQLLKEEGVAKTLGHAAGRREVGSGGLQENGGGLRDYLAVGGDEERQKAAAPCEAYFHEAHGGAMVGGSCD